MRDITDLEIKSLWRQNVGLPTMLYIHSPYCVKNCHWCVSRGRLKDEYFEKYFNEFLPAQFDNFKEIIDLQNIKCIYFGGGTPSYYSDLHNLKPIFEKIRYIKNVEKVIELHAGIPITDETIDTLIAEGFNTVILCIQSFNKELTLKYGRLWTDENDLFYIIKRFHDVGIRVGTDIIHYPLYGIEIFRKDLKTLMQYKPDEISIAALYQARWDRENPESRHLNISLFLKTLKDEIPSDLYFSEHPLTEENFKINRVTRFISYDFQNSFYGQRFYSFIHLMDEGETPDGDTSCIGLGSYNNIDKDTYSHIGRKYTYCERWDGNQVKYTMLKELTFFDKIRAYVDWLEKNTEGSVPFGTEIRFINFCNDMTLMSNVEDKMCQIAISSPVSSSYGSHISQLINDKGIDNILKDYINEKNIQ